MAYGLAERAGGKAHVLVMVLIPVERCGRSGLVPRMIEVRIVAVTAVGRLWQRVMSVVIGA
jgi:hypothetical protein